MRALPSLLLLLLSGAVYSHTNDKIHLSWWIDPLPIDTVKSGGLWDFRNASVGVEESGACYGASYMVYGDSLLSETVDNHRRWYSITNNGLDLVREESFDYSSVPDSVIPTSCFQGGTHPVITDYMSRGEETHSIISIREGKYLSYPCVPGKMIIPSGDTLQVSASVEKCSYIQRSISHSSTDSVISGCNPVAMISGDSINSSVNVTYSRYRWFDSSSFPIAVQTYMCGTGENDHKVFMETSTYTVDFDTYCNDNLESVDKNLVVENPFSNLIVESNSGRLVLRPGDDADFQIPHFEVDIVSSGGIPYYSKVHEYSGSPVEIPCNTFPAGSYIVGVRYGSFVEKRMLTIE